MSRKEFTKATKRAAWERSGKACEAEGQMYGMDHGVRCGDDLTRTGVEYDHIILDANSKDNSLENCAAVCPSCHRIKTTTHDIPKAAKTLRQQDRDRGIKRGTGRGFRKIPSGYRWDWSKGRAVPVFETSNR